MAGAADGPSWINELVITLLYRATYNSYLHRSNFSFYFHTQSVFKYYIVSSLGIHRICFSTSFLVFMLCFVLTQIIRECDILPQKLKCICARAFSTPHTVYWFRSVALLIYAITIVYLDCFTAVRLLIFRLKWLICL